MQRQTFTRKKPSRFPPSSLFLPPTSCHLSSLFLMKEASKDHGLAPLPSPSLFLELTLRGSVKLREVTVMAYTWIGPTKNSCCRGTWAPADSIIWEGSGNIRMGDLFGGRKSLLPSLCARFPRCRAKVCLHANTKKPWAEHSEMWSKK